jgi:hypothetical protein
MIIDQEIASVRHFILTCREHGFLAYRSGKASLTKSLNVRPERMSKEIP